MNTMKAAPALKCFHCGQPVQQVQPQGSAFRTWRHLDGRMWCPNGGTIATPDYAA